MPSRSPHPLCPRYHLAVELLGRRWAGAIVRVLMDGPRRYNEVRGVIPEISDRMLSERLRELEEAGVLTRRVLPEPPVRVEYELTDKGRALESAIDAIGKWAEQWIALPGSTRGSSVAGRRGAPRPAGARSHPSRRTRV